MYNKELRPHLQPIEDISKFCFLDCGPPLFLYPVNISVWETSANDSVHE